MRTKRSSWNIIFWWEIRRLLFNFVLVGAAALSLWIADIEFFTAEMGSGDYFVSLVYFGYVVAVNFLYTLGWVMELLIRNRPAFAPRFFLTILGLSVFGMVILTTSLVFLLTS